jgi:hypothetical protein
MQNNDEIIGRLIAAGLIGNTLGALLLDRIEEGTLGVIARAALLGTYEAAQKARQTGVPVLTAEKGNLYAFRPTGEKRFIKKIPQEPVKVPTHFMLQ